MYLGSHTYCHTCLEGLIKAKNDDDTEFIIKCPQCLNEHLIPNGSIESFPRNLAIQQLLDIKPTQLVSDKHCESCMSEFAFSNCLHCSKLVCLDCKDKHRVEFKNKIEKSISILNEKCSKFIGKQCIQI